MGLLSHDLVRLSDTDPRHHYLLWKLRAGENVRFDVETDPESGDYIVVSANQQIQGRNVVVANEDMEIPCHAFLVLADASKNPVNLTLPRCHDFLGHLSIVCVDPSHGINIVPNGSANDQIFNTSNMAFVSSGDAVMLTSDRNIGGNWYVVGRHFTSFYA